MSPNSGDFDENMELAYGDGHLDFAYSPIDDFQPMSTEPDFSFLVPPANRVPTPLPPIETLAGYSSSSSLAFATSQQGTRPDLLELGPMISTAGPKPGGLPPIEAIYGESAANGDYLGYSLGPTDETTGTSYIPYLPPNRNASVVDREWADFRPTQEPGFEDIGELSDYFQCIPQSEISPHFDPPPAHQEIMQTESGSMPGPSSGNENMPPPSSGSSFGPHAHHGIMPSASASIPGPSAGNENIPPPSSGSNFNPPHAQFSMMPSASGSMPRPSSGNENMPPVSNGSNIDPNEIGELSDYFVVPQSRINPHCDPTHAHSSMMPTGSRSISGSSSGNENMPPSSSGSGFNPHAFHGLILTGSRWKPRRAKENMPPPSNGNNFNPHAHNEMMPPSSNNENMPPPITLRDYIRNSGFPQPQQEEESASLSDNDEPVSDQRKNRRTQKNSRERVRIADLNSAFDDLKKICVDHYNADEKNFTKMNTLHSALALIIELENEVRKRNMDPRILLERSRKPEVNNEKEKKNMMRTKKQNGPAAPTPLQQHNHFHQ